MADANRKVENSVRCELLLDVALQMTRIEREIFRRRLDQERVEATAMLNRAKRMGGHAKADSAAERIRLKRNLAQVRAELALGLVV